MSGRSLLVATAEQKAALQELSRSDVHGEADRARAILLTLQGWTSPQLAQAFGVTPDAVRHWRGWFSERGVDALHGWTIPGREVNATSLPLGKSPFRDGKKPARRLGVIVGTAVEDACHGP